MNTHTRLAYTVSSVLAAIAGVTLLASMAAAANTSAATKEIDTAHAHAAMAQTANSLDEAHAHLHHVINCLVGPNGAGYDASAENPCKGQGNGAIPDSANASALHGKLESALADAQAGLKSNDLGSVHQDAAKAAAALGATPAQKPKGAYTW
ncbi:MAG: hypothetical protein KGL98_01820 [Gammaproteobacteria bacterium]|nr:hypothetical protein [Gammaproteobacteria bacterium]MDE1984569.1 hypothetical protein [Gammaproteobacteria bacterium]MDE2109216.1 hypothetical protein [Gammaproteobacteria bacterium]MDE2459960.1 hypothetical protein [Gammaproteobacteria bacterium]